MNARARVRLVLKQREADRIPNAQVLPRNIVAALLAAMAYGRT